MRQEKIRDRYNYVQRLKSPELINSVAQEPEGSSPRSQQLSTGPYPESVESNPPPPPVSRRSILIPSSQVSLMPRSCNSNR
jgi:hypothetical protein